MASNDNEIGYTSDLISQQIEDDETADNVWDDELLIKVYEKFTKKVDDALQTQQLKQKESSNSKNDKSKNERNSANNAWKVGHYCRAIYTEDGNEYEAQIKRINKSKYTCLVKYIGYGNEEEHFLSSLLPSNGIEARRLQESQAALETEQESNIENQSQDTTNYITTTSSEQQTSDSPKFKLPSIVPPPPSFLTNSNKPEDEALTSMLMSWYMSGYHTGFYEGLKSRIQ